MKLRSKAGGTAAAAIVFGLRVPTMAQAEADAPSTDDLTPQQVQAIDAWEGSEVNFRPGRPVGLGNIPSINDH